ncbi:hypothetical protein AArc1_3203 [Natrarchaeobaculum sulfurireducens]|uniref:Uncharacterized protein n=1 Tax=Natrarchaeobaculum sulfurireducens TaxID=2044521 RepID=A0A346PJ13_9EURY|nr:hypothetical protein AArc1_3203 [Natrarchaeobaculum sulfurireducens]
MMYGIRPSAPLQRVLKAALNAGWKLSPQFGDDYVYWIDDKRFTAANNDEVVEAVDSLETTAVAIERNDLRVWIEKDTDVLPTVETWHLYLWANKYEFGHRKDARTQAEARARVQQYLDLVELAVVETDPDYGFGKFGSIVSPKVVPTVDELLSARVLDVFWLNVFDSAAVERMGRERVLEAPAWEVRELETGHVMLVASDNPFEPADEWADGEEHVAEYLDVD